MNLTEGSYTSRAEYGPVCIHDRFYMLRGASPADVDFHCSLEVDEALTC